MLIKGIKIHNKTDYTLTSAKSVSAAVYKNDGTGDVLIQTLFSNEQQEAGSYQTPYWDGKDDEGNLVADGNYKIKVLSNNVQYEWEGVLGNSSTAKSGPTVHNPANEGFADMVVTGNTVYYVTEYNEGKSSDFKFSKNAIQVKLPAWTDPEWQKGRGGLISSVICTDGIKIYFGGVITDFATGGDPLRVRSFVYARNVSDGARSTFSSGVMTQPGDGPTDFVAYPSTIDNYQPSSTNNFYRVRGIAVQVSGDYLFVARDYVNSLHVLNKTTGALVQSLTYTVPTSLDVQGDFLWMITQQTDVKKYPINSDGTLGSPVLTLSGLVKPGTVKITPDGTKVYVVDAGSSQQIKIYNSNTGALISTFGQLGGYVSSPEVADDKFMFKSSKDWQQPGRPYPFNLEEIISAPLAFDAADNSYWLGDRGNFRMLHFSSSNVLLETITITGYNYSCSVDYNNPTRVFSNYLEYEVDYSKALDAAGAWKLKRNWAYNVSFDKDDQFGRLKGVATLSNGRTYAMNRVATGNQMVELSGTGLRFFGSILSYGTTFNKDGSLITYNKGAGTLGDPSAWQRKALTGFDGSNNLTWGSASLIASNTSGKIDPSNDGSGLRQQQITSSNILTYFDDEKSGGYHLGGINVSGNKWLWRASPSTHIEYRGEFPTDGTFDLGNDINYAGGGMQVIEQNIFYSYKGENYKANQVNKYNHFYDNGLMIGQFGVVGADANLAGEAAEMMAGNTTTLAIVKVGSVYYLYHNDESYHSGVHRWKITGLNTIQEQVIPVIKSGIPAAPTLNYTDLMAGLPFNSVLANSIAGWTRSSSDGNMSVKTSYTTYNKTNGDDVYLSGITGTEWVKRSLPNSQSLASWSIAGKIAYISPSETGNNYFEVLDNNDRVIFRFSKPQSYPSLTVLANSTTLVTGLMDALNPIIKKNQPFEIKRTGSSLTITYTGYTPVTVGVFDNLADISYPKTIKITLSAASGEHKVDVANLKFYPQYPPPPNPA